MGVENAAGWFTSIEVPEVIEVGGRIRVTIGHYFNNPGAMTWSGCLMCEYNGVVKILDTHKIIGAEHQHQDTYDVATMPNKRVSIKFRLLAHDSYGHSWKTSEFEGTSDVMILKKSYYRYIEPEEEPVVPVAGRIIKKELDFDGQQRAVPVSGVTVGESGQVHVWGRNDSGDSQKLGVSWIVMGPDGQARENYSDWTGWKQSPGEDHEFIGGRFNLNKVGTYRLTVILWANEDNPTQVDSFTGTLCTVQEEVYEYADIRNVAIRVTGGQYLAGQLVPIEIDYEYKGADQRGQYIIELGTGISPTFSTKYTYSPVFIDLPSSEDFQFYSLSAYIEMPTGRLEPGKTYSVKARIGTLEVPTKEESDVDYNAIRFEESEYGYADIRNVEIVVAGGKYTAGDPVAFELRYEYKGDAQGGQYIIELGTGISPTFSTKYTFDAVPLNLQGSEDFSYYSIEGSFTLPSNRLKPGQTYSVKVRMQTLEVQTKEESDVDFNSIHYEEEEVPDGNGGDGNGGNGGVVNGDLSGWLPWILVGAGVLIVLFGGEEEKKPPPKRQLPERTQTRPRV